MKKSPYSLPRILVVACAALAFAVAPLSAQRGPGERGAGGGQENRPAPGSEQAETMMIGRLAQMNDEQLQRLRSAIDEILAMTPEQRAELANNAQELREQRRSEARNNRDTRREVVAEIPAAERAQLRQQMRDLSPEERRALRQELSTVPEERRVDAIRGRGRGQGAAAEE